MKLGNKYILKIVGGFNSIFSLFSTQLGKDFVKFTIKFASHKIPQYL
jgi:hypothetical protein